MTGRRRHTLRPSVALALVALISAGCGSNAPSETGTAGSTATGASKTATDQGKAVKFAECIRGHGVPHFPDPDPKGDFVFGIDVSPAVWKKAVDACKALEPPGALSGKRSPKQQSDALRFAAVRPRERREGLSGPRQRRSPHRHDEDPLLQSARWDDHPQRRDAEVRLDPETGRGGPEVRRSGWVLTGAAVLVAVAAAGGMVALSGDGPATAAAQAASANTAPVQKGKLSAAVSQDGTLTYRARPDGSPFSVDQPRPRDVHGAARGGGQGRLRRCAVSGGRQAGAAAVRHGPGLPRTARGRHGHGRPSAQPQPARARRRRRLHGEDRNGTEGAPAPQRRSRERLAGPR